MGADLARHRDRREDFGLPTNPELAARQIVEAFGRARGGELVEVGCLGGSGRTGTVLACMAVLAGVPQAEAVAWVRANYRPQAVETADQEAWVRWFADWVDAGKEFPLSDDELTDRWERQELGGSGVSHLDHVRVAWVLQRRHGHAEAEERLVEGTRKGCDHYGVPEKFDERLTRRWTQAISEAAARGPESESFTEFIDRNPELRRGDLYSD